MKKTFQMVFACVFFVLGQGDPMSELFPSLLESEESIGLGKHKHNKNKNKNKNKKKRHDSQNKNKNDNSTSLLKDSSHSFKHEHHRSEHHSSEHHSSEHHSSQHHSSHKHKHNNCLDLSYMNYSPNTLVFDHFQGSTGTKGQLMIGGDAILAAYAVGDDIADEKSKKDSLVVLGKLDFHSGNVFDGNIVCGDCNDVQPGVSAGLSDDNELIEDSTKYEEFFSSAQSYYETLSERLSNLEDTGKVDIKTGDVYLRGTNSGTHEVFSLTCAYLMNEVRAVHIEKIAEDATVVVNIAGVDNCGFSGNLDLPDSQKTLFNFYEAQQFIIAYASVEGSLLAPYAGVIANTGQMNGQSVVNKWDGQVQQLNNPFTGCLPG